MTEPRVFLGRKRIYTAYDVNTIRDDELIGKIISDAFTKHMSSNKLDMEYLLNFYLGKHNQIIEREKEVRADINNKLIINLQKAIVRDTTGYFMGTPVQYIARDAEKNSLAVKQLSDAMELEDRATVDKEIEDYCAIVGVGYKGIFFDSEPVNEVPFRMVSLSPLNTFVVYNTEIGSSVVLAVAYNTYRDINDNLRYNIIAYSTNYVFRIDTQNPMGINSNEITREVNVIGLIPIIEYQNNMWYKGDIEDVLSIINALDLLDSNNMDDVEQVIQSVLLLFGISAKQQEEIESVAPNSLLMFTGEQGINQDGKYISPQVDVTAITTFREHLEETMRVIAGVPDRKTRGGGGGDTGDAVKLRDGWADMELVARDKEKYWSRAESQAVRVALEMMRIGGIPLPISPIDLSIKFTRNKNDNLQSKAQAGATLHGMGLAHEDVLTAMELTNDIAEVARRWTENEEMKRQQNIEQMQMRQQNNPKDDKDTKEE